MLKSAIKLVVKGILVLAIVLVSTFLLLFSENTDAVDKALDSNPTLTAKVGVVEMECQKTQLRERLGLNLPVFYFRVTTNQIPRNWDPSLSNSARKTIEKWTYQNGNYKRSLAVYNNLSKEYETRYLIENDNWNEVIEAFTFRPSPHIKKPFPWPRIHFYANNQFHRWLTNALTGNLGTSYVSGKEVSGLIKSRIGWSVGLGILAVVISFFLGVPLGIWMANNHGTWIEKVASSLSFSFYSVPSFWLATMLIMFLGSASYFQLFKVGIVGGESGFKLVSYLVLPMVVYTYSSIVYLSRLVKQNVLAINNSAMARAANLRQVPLKSYKRNYVLKNALLPLITVFGVLLPSIIAGSIIVETIFSIQGMGQLAYIAANQSDVPVIMAVASLSALLSYVGFQLANLLYQKIDPRISIAS